MADIPYESESKESVFANPDMKWGEGMFDAFVNFKDSHIGREGNVKLALLPTTSAMYNRDDGTDQHLAYAHIT